MKLIIRGKRSNKNMTESEIKMAYAWSAQRLLGKKTYHNISCCIVFNKDLMEREGDMGGCEPKNVKKGIMPRKFTIWIDPTMSRTNQLRTFFHEMKHVQQYVRGDLEDIPGRVRWKRRFYDASESNYLDLPYEIEAVRAESELLREYVEWLDQYNITF